ncbi:hypothetical protein VQ045_21030 [Aurantimonas sp. E1-2-R+4]|uniref:hypothetical protein n=1 Tax=Aurantimonas sp. E1-2-R+4 TaxID=3113714 RepID=UPI002F93E9C4
MAPLGQKPLSEFSKIVGGRLDELSGHVAALSAIVATMPDLSKERIDQARKLLVSDTAMTLSSVNEVPKEVSDHAHKLLDRLEKRSAHA